MIIIFKKIEEIRKDVGYSQTEFANSFGLSYRSYQERLTHKQPNWKLSELIGITNYNEGQLEVEYDGITYNITINKL